MKTKQTSAEALAALRKIDFSQEAYRSYLIRREAVNNSMWIEKGGQLIQRMQPEQSWNDARNVIDKLVQS
jgi:hypothetical protein